MFLRFFTELRRAQVPVTLKEYLALIEGLERPVIGRSVDEFYHLARAVLVKDERNLDRFDQVFGQIFRGLDRIDEVGVADVQAEWLARMGDRLLSPEERAQVESMGGFDKLMQALAERARERRQEGGSGEARSRPDSPFGADGYHPEGVRAGQEHGRHGRAVKVWDRREFRNLDDKVEIGVRNIKVALRRLRRWARDGVAEELDLDATIRGTADKGYLDVQMRPERRNTVSVLLFLDIGGSMDPHVQVCEELFSAARAEFKTLEFFYFHNCLYEGVWKDNRRRGEERIATWDVLHRYPRDYKVIFVGDAAMSPYEITYPGGSVEHWNEEAGAVWLERVVSAWERVVWLNPTSERYWNQSPSTALIRQLVGDRMFPLTVEGLDRAMRELSR